MIKILPTLILAQVFCAGCSRQQVHILPVVSGLDTVSAALEKVAEFRKGDVRTPVVLRLAPGDYTLTESIRITRDHARADWAPLTITAEERTHRPRLLGGTAVKRWTRTRFNGRSDVWTADVSDLSLPTRLSLFFYNGRRMDVARWPNVDPKRPYTSGYAFAMSRTEGPEPWIQHPVDMYQDEIAAAERDRRRWSNPSEGWVIAFPRHNWSNYSIALTNVTSCGVLQLAYPHKRIPDLLHLWDRWSVMGLREELDRPGEWYLDAAAHRLYFLTPDGSDPNGGVATVACIPQMLKVSDGAANVVVESLELTGGEAGVLLENVDDVTVRGCALHDIGYFHDGYGISATGRRLTVADNDIWNIGGHGILIAGPKTERGFADRSGNAVRNNYIHHVGQIYSHGIGVKLDGQGIEVSHNYIHDTPRCGIFGYGRFCDIAYNRIRHVNTINDDTGAIYGGGWIGGQGTTVRYNHISDSIGFMRTWDGKYVFHHQACGIYADEGCGGIEVYGNLIERCHHAAMQLHNGRWLTISNNVFVSNGALPVKAGSGQLLYSTWNNKTNEYFMKVRRTPIAKAYHDLVDKDPRWLTFPSLRQAPDRDDVCFNANGTAMMGNQFVRNIVYYPDQGIGSMLLGQQKIQFETNPFDYNVYWPGQSTNLVQKSGRAMNWNEWRNAGQDIHSKIADPAFVNPAAGDWRLRAGSPAFALGFVDLPYEKMGLVRSRLRPTLPCEAEGLREHPEWLSE